MTIYFKCIKELNEEHGRYFTLGKIYTGTLTKYVYDVKIVDDTGFECAFDTRSTANKNHVFTTLEYFETLPADYLDQRILEFIREHT